MRGLSRLSKLTEDGMLGMLGMGADADGLPVGPDSEAPEAGRQAELASAVTLSIPAPKSSTIHKSFDEMEGTLREFLSAVMVIAKDLTDEASASADEAAIEITWIMNPEDIGRFISLAKQLPCWPALQQMGATFSADK